MKTEYTGTAYFVNRSLDMSISMEKSAIEKTSEIATVITNRRLAVTLNNGLSVWKKYMIRIGRAKPTKNRNAENKGKTFSNRYQNPNWITISRIAVITFGYLLSKIRLAEIIQNRMRKKLETVYSIPLCIMVSCVLTIIVSQSYY
ncbi:MAG: hypothetical protein K6F23_12300 [Solobacterium sp.]|nr:hypothetical protein [Solobacterium sp.]